MIKIDREKINQLVEIIVEAEKEGVEEAEKEYNSFLEEFTEESFDKNILYKCILNWKVNYLEDLNSNYHLINHLCENNLSYKILRLNERERFAAASLFFYDFHHKQSILTEQRFIDKLKTSIKISLKNITLFNRAKDIIYYINNDYKYNGKIQLPIIDNFEVGVFTILEDELNEFRSRIKRVINNYDARIEELTNNNIQIFNDSLILEKEVEKYRDNIFDLNTKLKFFSVEKESLLNYIEILKYEISKNDYTPVCQFNELYWGDNYPALKVLFDFLQKHNVVKENWSYFASIMSIQNLEPINLNSDALGKREIGYLLEKIKPFFLSEFRNRKDVYLSVLTRKFYIDYSPIDNNFQKNYIRDYKKANQWAKTKNIIDILCLDIAKRYF
ncbi:hypothetical protein [Lutibacter sp.]|uniref:hypothetical protein n=1 Tax=Lutibacter sp. TaxID=1925666 RepID=UPI001A21C35A|nr:hypothetical protein [Lutibacter sp.]MBI9041685.1 hypothetical protein [Lutibacter sp.]